MHFELSPEYQQTIGPLSSKEGEVKKPVISIAELEALCEGNEILQELLKDMVDSCLEYTITVANFKKTFSENKDNITRAAAEENSAIDTLRRSVHNKTISDINIFSRTLGKYNKNNDWMDEAGMDGQNRGAYGRFALTLTLSRL